MAVKHIGSAKRVDFKRANEIVASNTYIEIWKQSIIATGGTMFILRPIKDTVKLREFLGTDDVYGKVVYMTLWGNDDIDLYVQTFGGKDED